MLKFLQHLKKSKEKKTKSRKRRVGKTRRSGNIEEKIFVVFEIYLKQ